MAKRRKYTPQEDKLILDYVAAADTVTEGCRAAAEELGIGTNALMAHYYDLKRKEEAKGAVDLVAALNELVAAAKAKDDRIAKLEAEITLLRAKIKEFEENERSIARAFEVARQQLLKEGS